MIQHGSGTNFRFAILAWLSLVTWTQGRANEPINPDALVGIGGRWYVTKSEPATYYYDDAGRFLDLFSYHLQDSNNDGIPNLRLSHDQSALIVRSQGYPNHPTAIFPNSGNPNSIRVQDFTFRIHLRPQLAEKVTRVPMGAIGMAVNGVVFFNPFEQGGMNAVAGYSTVWLDSCCGHPQQTGVYHYHKYPSCLKSPFSDDGKQHSPVIGFAFDGFPIHGPYESEGKLAMDEKGERALDVCNGHSDARRGYHYHATPGRFPYVLGGYAGVPERSNNRELNRPRLGPIEDNASGESRLPVVIEKVVPGSAARGKTHRLQIHLQPSRAPRGLPSDPPDWIQLGPYEATAISRQGDIVSFDIAIDEDASLGILLDCHIEFRNANRPGPRLVFKQDDAFRVVE